MPGLNSVHEALAPVKGEPGTCTTDSELVHLALNGRPQAFARLLERHLQHVRRLIARRLQDPEDVLDVLQDTRLAAWKALGSFDTGRPFEAWLTSIALNKCRDRGRRKVLRSRLLWQIQEEQQITLQEGQLHAHGPEKLMLEREKLRTLQRALDELPQQFRQPLLLTVFQDLSQADAGRTLKLTVKAIENRVRRARVRLAQVLLSEGGP